MEHDNREKLEQNDIKNSESIKNASASEDAVEEIDYNKLIESKIADLRELQHEPNPHKKFDLIEAWMGSLEEFSLYENANHKQINQILELMESLKPFADEYANVLHTERGKIKQVSTYLK